MAITADTEAVLTAAAQWRDRALINGMSVLSDEAIWVDERVRELEEYFVNNLDMGEGTFKSKLEAQLAPTSPSAKKLAAEILWVMMLFPNNISSETKVGLVREVWGWSGDGLPSDHPMLGEPFRRGIGSGGPGYNNFRWAEFRFFVLILLQWTLLDGSRRANLLSDPWTFASWIDGIEHSQTRQFRHMLLHLLFPETFERISSGGHKREIDKAFASSLPEGAPSDDSLISRDRRLALIREAMERQYVGHDLDFYIPPLVTKWGEDKGSPPPPPPPPPGGYSPPAFHVIADSISKAGIKIDDRTLRRYDQGLTARKFVILCGVSGTGKSWLAAAYAEAIGAEHLIVPVAPNWTTNEDLLGYYNPLDKTYHDTEFSRFLRRAATEQAEVQPGANAKPFHLVLDEMNLARVEYYFARFLSAVETLHTSGSAQISLGPDESIALPRNLYFIGTVNVDETTHGFADKVYDRAQLIELEMSRELLMDHIGAEPYADLLMKVWDTVSPVAPFAFRVVDDIKRYVALGIRNGRAWPESLDEQLLQKILPKVKGTDPRIGDVLDALEQLLPNEQFSLSRRKLAAMKSGYQSHGFASYF